MVKQFIGTLGAVFAFGLACDDKSRAPLGITACVRQRYIVMSMEENYMLKLPDHQFVVAERHKLIPSVYAILSITNGKFFDASAVQNKGPTMGFLRSGNAPFSAYHILPLRSM